MQEETVRIEDLTTGYITRKGIVEIERHVNASLLSGELTCLLGSNGAGKSTLLRTLSGFQPPLGGNIIVDGENLRRYGNAELSRKISVVLTEKVDTNQMTVEQLVALGRSPYTGFLGKLTGRDKRIVSESMMLAGVGELAGRFVHTLSDGERQKVMIAKSLAQQTPVIYLDEPTAFLDFPSKVETMLLLKRLTKSQNKTIFQSTHDVNMALQLADKIWLVDKRLGVKIGTPTELAEAGELQKYFQGSGIRFNKESGLFDVVSEASESGRALTGCARR